MRRALRVLAALALLGGCARGALPTPRPVPPESFRLASTGVPLFDALRQAGLVGRLLATGATTGHVFDLLLERGGEGPGEISWRGPLVVGDPRAGDAFQRFLLLLDVATSVTPGARRVVPCRGFCLDPGRPPPPRGHVLPLGDAVLEGRRARVPVQGGRVATPDGSVPLALAGPDGVPREALAPGLVGPLLLLPPDGRLQRVAADREAWSPAPGTPPGLVLVLGADGVERGRAVWAPAAGEDAVEIATLPGPDGAEVPFPPALGLRWRLAERVVELAPGIARRTLPAEVADPASVTAQQALWSLADGGASEGPPSPAAGGLVVPTEARIQLAAAEALEAADAELAAEGGVDFSLLDLTRKG